jgi:hypothetical protein
MKKIEFKFGERKLIYIDGAAAPQEVQQTAQPPAPELKPQAAMTAAEIAPTQPEAQKTPEQIAASPDAAATMNQQTKKSGADKVSMANKNLAILEHITT